MEEKRSRQRLLCSDLITVHVDTGAGHSEEIVANLEDISRFGACLQTDYPIPPGASVVLDLVSHVLLGEVRYCVFRDIGYFAGIEFAPGSRWSEEEYRPGYLFDPGRLSGPGKP